jgi:plasmid replication DNA-binding protein KfrA
MTHNTSNVVIIMFVESPKKRAFSDDRDFESRAQALNARVAAAARVLTERGITPTVTRIRAALGGGSPNDLAPALKLWKASFAPALTRRADDPLPVQIADLAHELWQRATVAASVELKGGAAARQVATRGGEADALRHQVTTLRDQLERESIAFGELRAQSARHEAIARATLARINELEARERKHLRDFGAAHQRIAELQATIELRKSASPAPSRRRARAPARPHRTPTARRRKPAARTTPVRRKVAALRPPRTKPRGRPGKTKAHKRTPSNKTIRRQR